MTIEDSLEADGRGTSGDPDVDELYRRLNRCNEWETHSRKCFIEDMKFAFADSDNGFQWPNQIRKDRDGTSRPCLTMNITRQHNLQIINEGKRNKAGVKVIAAGNGATAESAKMVRALFDHIEYQSNAQTAYSVAREFQVTAGIGYWRLVTDWVPGTWEQEIYIRPVPDPLKVFLDPDCKERDKSDAMFGFVFDLVLKSEMKEAYPGIIEQLGSDSSILPYGVTGFGLHNWTSKHHVLVCEYFRRVPKTDKLLHFVNPMNGQRTVAKASRLPKEIARAVMDDPQTKWRSITEHEVEWLLAVGDRIVDRTIWPGSYIPIIPVLGEEIVVEGIMDRKGHTRYIKDAQRMYNYNASGQVEFVALQSKTPWTGAAQSIEEHESLWNSANTQNHSFLPFNHLDDNGQPIPAEALPRRTDPPQASPAFETGMQTAFNQLMMASGQWQNQMGMMGNERTGEAIKRRQDQGDTATYHFQDNFDIALVYTGKQLIDLFPKVYDTRRVLQIQAEDGTDMELEIDPGARLPYLQQVAHNNEVVRRVMNPALGRYDVRAVPGAASGSRREETVQALTLILTQAPALTGIIGDLLLAAMDFDKAQEAAQRLKRMVPPQALGQGPSQAEQTLQLQLQQTQAALGETLQKLGKEQLKLTGKDQMRDIDAYKAETDRFKALAEQAAALDPDALRQTIEDLVREAAQTHLTPILKANAKDLDAEPDAEGKLPPSAFGDPSMAPVPGARMAGDGEWYLTDPTRKGKYLRVAPMAQEHANRGIIANG